MAIKITKSIQDATGTPRTETYVNIGSRYTYDKNLQRLWYEPNYYASQQAYNDGKKAINMDNGISSFDITMQDAQTQLLFDFLYNPLVLALIEKYELAQGEIWSDKTGSWEQINI